MSTLSPTQSDIQYSNLEERINGIISKFTYLNDLEDSDISESTKQDLIRAFILLCHAEFEYYLESIAKRILNEGKTKWNQDKIANYNMSSLFIVSSLNNTDTINTKANKIFQDYTKVVEGNHGIKEENIKKLFSPLGLPISHFDSIFLADMNSFGCERGLLAHTSAIGIQNQLDFYTSTQKIKNLLNEFYTFELATKNTPT